MNSTFVARTPGFPNPGLVFNSYVTRACAQGLGEADPPSPLKASKLMNEGTSSQGRQPWETKNRSGEAHRYRYLNYAERSLQGRKFWPQEETS